jgi:multidrug transporter EmrE-like cation transporter
MTASLPSQSRMLPFPLSCTIHESLLHLPSHIHLPPRFYSTNSSRVRYLSALPSGEYQGQMYDDLSINSSMRFSAPIAGSSLFPPLLYVVQNSLQFVAVSNLPVATFQVTYQMKILTTAAFSVLLLRRRLSATKWVSLFFLATGVAIVQIQTSTGAHAPPKASALVGSAHESAPRYMHIMSPLKGFGAVTAACFTSGLAGVYFEMVLKNSKADLWVRNIQLSLFSLIPALVPVLYGPSCPQLPWLLCRLA